MNKAETTNQKLQQNHSTGQNTTWSIESMLVIEYVGSSFHSVTVRGKKREFEHVSSSIERR